MTTPICACRCGCLVCAAPVDLGMGGPPPMGAPHEAPGDTDEAPPTAGRPPDGGAIITADGAIPDAATAANDIALDILMRDTLRATAARGDQLAARDAAAAAAATAGPTSEPIGHDATRTPLG